MIVKFGRSFPWPGLLPPEGVFADALQTTARKGGLRKVVLTMAFQPLRLDQAGAEFWKLCIYGPPGVGKSTLGCMTQRFNTFVVDVDDGISAGKAYRVRNGLRMDTVQFGRVKTAKEFDECMGWFHANVRHFQLLVVDTFTEIHQIIALEQQKKSSHQTLEQREWGIVRTVTTQMTQYFKHLPCHVLMLGHEINKHDPNLGQVVWRPALDGRSAFEYAKHIDCIGRYQMMWAQGPAGPDGRPTQELARAINFGPAMYSHFKDRSSMLSTWEAPDIDNILWKLSQSVTPLHAQDAHRAGNVAAIAA